MLPENPRALSLNVGRGPGFGRSRKVWSATVASRALTTPTITHDRLRLLCLLLLLPVLLVPPAT